MIKIHLSLLREALLQTDSELRCDATRRTAPIAYYTYTVGSPKHMHALQHYVQYKCMCVYTIYMWMQHQAYTSLSLLLFLLPRVFRHRWLRLCLVLYITVSCCLLQRKQREIVQNAG